MPSASGVVIRELLEPSETSTTVTAAVSMGATVWAGVWKLVPKHFRTGILPVFESLKRRKNRNSDTVFTTFLVRVWAFICVWRCKHSGSGVGFPWF